MGIDRAAEKFNAAMLVTCSQQVFIIQQVREMTCEPFVPREEARMRRNALRNQILDEWVMRASENDGIELCVTRGAEQPSQKVLDVIESLCAAFDESRET